jgi:sulfatase modifying factor 1
MPLLLPTPAHLGRATVFLAVLGACSVPVDRSLADTFGSGSNQFDIDFTTIGNPANAADSRTGRGSVSYVYRIGTYEVSIGMINAANAAGGLALTPGDDAPGTAAQGMNWFEAARFVNWLNTNSGYAPAYKFATQPGQPGYNPYVDNTPWQPGDIGYDPANPYRNTRALYFLPNENEWYKAAYYNPAGSNYFLYPTGSDSPPTAVLSGTNLNTAVFLGAGVGEAPDFNNAGGLSPYGTMAQGGNVWEWIETLDITNGTNAILRGGSRTSLLADLASTGYRSLDAGQRGYGFRVASLVTLVDSNSYLSSLVPSSGSLDPVPGTSDLIAPSSVVFANPNLVWHEFYNIAPGYNYGNSTMNSRPAFLAFTSPEPGAARLPSNIINAVAVAGAMDGGGTVVADRIFGSTTPAFGTSYLNYTLTESLPGARLPNAAATGTLSSQLILADGTILPAGTGVYADFSGFRLDPNKPSNFWHNQATTVTTQVYEGGAVDLFYYDPSVLNPSGLPIGYRRFARYTNAAWTGRNNYVANTNSASLVLSAAPADGSLVPAEVAVSTSAAIGIGFSVVPAELNTTDPYVGFFFTQTRALTFNFGQGAIAANGFGALIKGYTSTVPWAVSNYSLTPSVAGRGASVTVNSNAVTPGTPSPSAPLSVGTNLFNIVVTAGDGSGTREYTVSVIRSTFSAPGEDLSGQNFAGQDLHSADIQGANLSGANLNGANLAGASALNANFSGADLRNANLAGADLSGATLDGVISGGIIGTPSALPTGWTLVGGTLVPPDITPPVITLLGANPMGVPLGGAFVDPGARVTDNIDAPRTIYGTGSVNTAIAGIYTINYEATDSAGNAALPVTRSVEVAVAPQNFAVIDFGGTVQTFGDARNVGFVGTPGSVATADGGNIVARQGGVAMVYNATGYAVAANSPIINEAGATPESSTRTTLAARILFDDDTFAPAGAPVTWSPVTNQVITVSPEGVAQAQAVYQDTVAAFGGIVAGVPATNFLTVVNVLPDNFGAWAGDTFDDAWEIAQGMSAAVNPNALNSGVPVWQLYAMGRSLVSPVTTPLATAQAGTNGYLSITYSRNPYATNYTFAVQETGNLSLGFANLVNPVSVTNEVGGLQQITTRGSTPINSTNRQFLRLQITKP